MLHSEVAEVKNFTVDCQTGGLSFQSHAWEVLLSSAIIRFHKKIAAALNALLDLPDDFRNWEQFEAHCAHRDPRIRFEQPNEPGLIERAILSVAIENDGRTIKFREFVVELRCV